MSTVREFITQAYELISPNSPTSPLHGNDLSKGIRVLNQVLRSYAANGQMITIAKTETVNVVSGQQEVVCGDASYLPVPDITAGRLANLETAWLNLDGTIYPLRIEDRNVFHNSYKYNPLSSLPVMVVVYPETQVTRLRIYPSPKQQYEFYIRGKFQLPTLTSNDNLDGLPGYFEDFLLLAVSRKIAAVKGRSKAWTPFLQGLLDEAKLDMIAASEVNLDIENSEPILLNGANRVRAGV